MDETEQLEEFAMPSPRCDRVTSEVTSSLREQQKEHEGRLAELLAAHQQQLLEAVRAELRAELQRLSFAAGKADTVSARTLVGRNRTPEISPVPVGSHEMGGALTPAPQRHQHRKNSLTEGLPAVHKQTTGTAAASSYVGRRAMVSGTQQFNSDLQVHQATILEQSFNARIGRMIQAPLFEYLVCLIVVLNAVTIGWYADWTMRNLYKLEEEPPIFRILEVFFSAVFAVELLLRVVGEGWHFLKQTNRNRPWNILDTLLVISVAVEELLAQFLISVTIVRVLRMLRAVRVIRIIRITRFFTDLRVMVKGLICAARSLFWVIVLLFTVIYMFAVCLMQLTADSIAARKPLMLDRSTDEILAYVGSLEDTMFTLYKSVTGGMEWGDLADQLAEKGVLVAAGVYSAYMAFAMLCVLNIVTGVFVQNASQIANNDQIELGLEHLERRRAWMREVIELFKAADTNGNGQIDWKSFQTCLNKPSVQACFSQLGINLEAISSRGLFCLFDINDDGTIDLEEFAHGILKLHGTARSFDLHRVGNDSKKILQQVHQITTRLA